MSTQSSHVMKFTSNSVYPPPPSVNELINTEIAKLDYINSIAISKGFYHEVRGTVYHFSYKVSDQSNYSQKSGEVNASIQHGKMTDNELMSLYGLDISNFDRDKLPVVMPEKMTIVWQGHKDGVNHTLILSIPEYMALARSGGNHLEQCLAGGWETKALLRACTSKEQVSKVASDNNIEERYRTAKNDADELGIVQV